MADHGHLKLPEAYGDALRSLADLEPAQVDALAIALKDAEPTLRPWDFAQQIAKRVNDDGRFTEEIVRLLTGLHITKVRRNLSADQLIEDVRRALNAAEDDKSRQILDQWHGVAERLQRLLGVDQALSISAKALDVLFQNEHTLCTQRVITDLRPVFSAQPGDGVDAAVIVHTLKLTYHQDDGQTLKDIYVAMDGQDLKRLRETLERAEAKAASLRQLMVKAGLVDLDPVTNDATD